MEPNAVYVHCAAHNLNLVLNDAVRKVIDMHFFLTQYKKIFFLGIVSKDGIFYQVFYLISNVSLQLQ